MTPAPNLTIAALVQTALAKCAPAPKWHRPLLQLAPRGWSCRCGANALVAEDESRGYCASCGLDEFGIDDLYFVTRDADGAADVLGAALDGFARFVDRSQEEAV